MKRLAEIFTLLNLHLAVFAVLIVLDLALAGRLFAAWHAAGEDKSSEYQQQQITYQRLNAEMAHLTGLPAKVDASRRDAQQFYDSRIAPNYSTVAAQIGDLTQKTGVRLTRAQYTASPAVQGLSEVRIDASLSGDYTAMMRFINSLERDRDHVFFIINGLTLTGQQGGMVNLRLRVTTYLSANATDLPPADQTTTDPAIAAAASSAGEEAR